MASKATCKSCNKQKASVSVDLCACRGTLGDLDEADDDDEPECQELSCGEEVLHSGGCLHTVAVHEGQQDCRGKQRETMRQKACKWLRPIRQALVGLISSISQKKSEAIVN